MKKTYVEPEIDISETVDVVATSYWEGGQPILTNPSYVDSAYER